MKFQLHCPGKFKGRLGCISEIARFPHHKLETPALFIYTKYGTVPHISYEVLQFITTELLCMQYPLSNVYQCCDSVKEYKHGISSFVGLPEYISYCSLLDGTVNIPTGFFQKHAVALWSSDGKKFITADRYMDLMETFKPDIYVTLSESSTNIQSGQKRCNTAVERTKALSDHCLKRHSESKILKNKAIIGVIQGGYSVVAREKCARYFASTPVNGFLIDGLFTNGTQVENLEFGPVETVIKNTLVHLPENKVKIISGCWSPHSVLKLIKLGIDVFDTSLPYSVTERGSALVFDYDFSILENDNINEESEWNRLKSDANYEISLLDSRYKEDLKPLVNGCACLTCQKHTRSYINHLLVTKEMLAYVLLMIHNIHYYLEFFAAIRRFLRNSYTEDSTDS